VRGKTIEELIKMVINLIVTLGDTVLMIWDNIDGILNEENDN
jgi:hypothetical protein